ncbi:uncharacterized protein N7458_009353 [Penicillium daleae]|uniref:HAT C-terminal dimerisation domain-containing protein n=1 Tax=Penicillium daleae TaxID=63821 RepID=A0AAD6FYC3_9EURO|nr:uncharacterized protein N7458_009353 [Penicillium daleae]KAJ5438355.1 hypothetical protein N7458_009353 [Penicillium daleae]
MLRRAKRLQSVLDGFCSKYGHPHLKLDQEQWRQIDYLRWITQPFFQFTTALSKTKDVTVYLVFAIYNKLFDHLEKSIKQLTRRSKTDDISGDIFAISIAPQHKLQFFRSKDWGPEWLTRYRQSFVDYFEPYKQRLSEEQTGNGEGSSTQSAGIDLDRMIGLDQTIQAGQQDELARYLDSATVSGVPIRAFWKENQTTFPALAKLARDVLSIPSTGAGVERLFNTARDVCHYRRGSLNATTIQELMLYRCTTQFEVEEDGIAFRKEYLSEGEIEADHEEKDAQQLEGTVDPISDDEESNEDENTIKLEALLISRPTWYLPSRYLP